MFVVTDKVITSINTVAMRCMGDFSMEAVAMDSSLLVLSRRSMIAIENEKFCPFKMFSSASSGIFHGIALFSKVFR